MKQFYVDTTTIKEGKEFTFLNQDESAGATAIGVRGTIGFGTDIFVLIGEMGEENAEIARIPADTAIGGFNIPIASPGLRFYHPSDTKVYRIDWNQVAFSRSTGIGTQKGTLATKDIEPDLLETQYRDVTNTTGYGFVEFYNSIDSTYSSPSDPIPYAGFDADTVWAIKDRALKGLNEKIDGDIITHDVLNEMLWEGRRELHDSPGKRPFRNMFEQVIGNVSTGMYKILMPDNCQRPYTAENLYGLRIGRQKPIDYIDKKEWTFYFRGVAHGLLATAYATTNSTLYINNSKDFNDEGSVTIEEDVISYTFNERSANALSISTAGSHAHVVNSDVWQNASYGLPERFTVFGGGNTSAYIYFNRPVGTAYVDQNIYADYYRMLVPMDSDADKLDEPEWDIYVPFLRAKIKQRKAQGNFNLEEDSDWREWTRRKNEALAKERTGQDINITPDISHLL
jgi:hypothetical protein